MCIRDRCSIESKLSEICSEAKRETNESRECVCTEKNKTNENCSDKCKNMIPEKELINDNNMCLHYVCIFATK